MGDQDELRAVGHAPDRLVVTSDVGLVERRVDLVEDAERARLVLEDGEDQAHRGERLLAAAHQLDVAELLAGRLREDLDAGLEHVLGVGEPELGLAAAEHLREELLEARVHALERGLEELLRLAVHLRDGLVEIVERLLEVLLLAVVIGEALFGFGVLAHGVHVDRAHPLDEIAELGDPAAVRGVDRRALVVVADHLRELEPTELLAHALEQVLLLDVEPLERHLVLAEPLAGLVDLLPEAAEVELARGERLPRRLERLLRLVERGVRRLRLVDRGDQELAREDDRRRRLAGSLGRLGALVVEPRDPTLELVARTAEALDGAARGVGALLHASQAHLAIGDDRLLPEHALAPLGGDHLGVLERGLRLFLGRPPAFESRARVRLLVGRVLGVSAELLELVRDGAASLLVRGGEILGAAQVLLGRDEGELALVRLGARALERGADLGHPEALRLLLLEERRHVVALLRDQLVELAHLALLLDHPGRDRVAGAAGDASVGVDHRPVERDQRDAEPFAREAKRVGRGLDDHRVAHQRANQRLVLGGEAQAIDERSDHAITAHRFEARARDERGASREDQGASRFPGRELGEEGDAALDVVDHHALEPLAEQPRERRRQLGRRLQPIGDEPDERRILRREQRLHAGADALEPRVQLLERAEAAALLRELVLRVVDLLVEADRTLAELAHLDVEAHLLVGRDPFALGELRRVTDQLAPAVLEVLTLELEATHLVLELHLALAHLGEAALEAGERGFGGGDLGLRLRDALLLLGRLLIGDALAVAELLEALELLDRRLGLARLVGLDRRELALELLLLDDEPDHGLLELGLLARCGGAALVEVAHPVLAARDLGLVRAHLVVGRERGILSLLGALLGRRGLEPGDLELGLARVERRLRRLLLLGVLGASGVLDLGERDDLEQLVRRLVEHEVLELALVGDVALGLGRLALERREVSLDLAHDVADAEQVLPRLVHLELGLLLPGLVLRDAGRLFDQHAPVFGARAHDEADLALLDDRVRLRADAGAEEQIGDVLEPHLRLVDEVLAGPVAEEAAGDRDLGVLLVFERQAGGAFGVGVVEDQRDLGHAVRAAVLGAVEDDVAHRPAAEVLRALLAHAPADRVDDVRLAAAVRTDDADDIRVEVDDGAVDERLEAGDLELADAHVVFASLPGRPAPRHM